MIAIVKLIKFIFRLFVKPFMEVVYEESKKNNQSETKLSDDIKQQISDLTSNQIKMLLNNELAELVFSHEAKLIKVCRQIKMLGELVKDYRNKQDSESLLVRKILKEFEIIQESLYQKPTQKSKGGKLEWR